LQNLPNNKKKNLRRYYAVYYKKNKEDPFFHAQMWSSLPLARKTFKTYKKKGFHDPVIVELTQTYLKNLPDLPSVSDPSSHPGLKVIKTRLRKK